MAAKSILDQLYEEIGLDAEEFTGTVSDLLRQGFRQLSKEDVERISSLFQYAPQIIAQKVAEGRIQAAFTEATKDSYRLVMNAGRHLAKSQKYPGFFSSNTFDAENKNMSPAVWAVNDATLSITKVEQVIANAMNAASFITGQYFMSQINMSMSALDTDIQNIQGYIETEKRSEFEAYISWVEYYASHMQFILSDGSDSRRQNAAQDVGRMNQYFIRTIKFCRNRITEIQHSMGRNDSADSITKNANTICRYLVYYVRALTLLCDGINMGIGLDGVVDVEELNVFLNKDMKKQIDDYGDFFRSTIDWLNQYLHSASVYNKLSPLQSVASIGKGVLSGSPYLLALGAWGAPAGLIRGIGKVSDAQKKYTDENTEKMNDLIRALNKKLTPCRDPRLLDKAVQTLEEYIAAARRTEFVKVGDKYYTNMPLAGH